MKIKQIQLTCEFCSTKGHIPGRGVRSVRGWKGLKWVWVRRRVGYFFFWFVSVNLESSSKPSNLINVEATCWIDWDYELDYFELAQLLMIVFNTHGFTLTSHQHGKKQYPKKHHWIINERTAHIILASDQSSHRKKASVLHLHDRKLEVLNLFERWISTDYK